MEIEAPAHAIAIWTEGERIFCRFPDRHLVTFDNPLQLMNTLKHRERIRRGAEMTVGTNAAPVQYDIDKISTALKGKSEAHHAAIIKKGEATRERERARRLRLDAKMQRDKAAERELRELNLL